MNEINGAGRKRLAVIAATAAVAMSALMSAASPVALAAPKGIFARFAQCPTSVPGVTLCMYAEITSGELAIGPLHISIDKTVVLQGGGVSTGKLNEYFMLPPTNGEAISPTKLEVPGGLRAILGCPDPHGPYHRSWWSPCPGRIHAEDWNEVTAKLEPAASATNPARMDIIALLEEGEETGVTLPIKIKLENPLLGETCHLGSEAHPIELRLTTGTTSPPPPNQPITGAGGNPTQEEEEGQGLTGLTGNTLVGNAFLVPPAEGCGGHLAAIVDQRINQALGLESPAGHNTAILTGTHRIAEVPAVLASEKFPTEENPPPPPSHHHGHHHHHWWWSEH